MTAPTPSPTPFSWDSKTWGQSGHNVHISSTGSDLNDRHGELGHG